MTLRTLICQKKYPGLTCAASIKGQQKRIRSLIMLIQKTYCYFEKAVPHTPSFGTDRTGIVLEPVPKPKRNQAKAAFRDYTASSSNALKYVHNYHSFDAVLLMDHTEDTLDNFNEVLT